MKFTILTKTFADMIKTVSRANGARTNGEGGISLRVPDEGNTLTARAGNDMISISHTEKIISGESGEVRIPNTYLQDITMRLAGEMVTFSHKDTEGKAKISAGPSDFQLVTSNNRLFFPENKSEWEFSVSSATLASAIKKVTFAAAKNDNKPIFNGCHLEVADGKLTLAATNTHRLAIKQCTAKYEQENFNAAKAKEGVTIPAQALNEAAHIIKDDTGDTRIAIGKSHVAFYSQETTLIANLLSGKYPDFRRVIPQGIKTSATMDKGKFIGMMDRMSVIAKNNLANDIILDFQDVRVKCSSSHKEVGAGEETVTAEISGEQMRISFNTQYLSDGLKVTDGEKFTIDMKAPLSPAIIRDLSDKDYTYIVTPVRINPNGGAA